MTTDLLPATVAPSDLVRPLHSLLGYELGLKSPLGPAVEMLDRATRLQVGSTAGVQSAEAARRAIARAIAVGDAQFDEATIRAFDEGRLWLRDDTEVTPPAVGLANSVKAQAHQAAATELLTHAGGIFDTLAAEATRVVATFAALPEPPKNLFTAGDPTTALTRAPEHAATYSAMLAANDRFGAVTRAANLVRGPAGYGAERLPGGAPPLAFAYRNWMVALEKENSELRSVPRHFRLWFTVLDGWEPGVWKPEDIETTAQDRTFSAQLKRFGSAVGIPSGQPAA